MNDKLTDFGISRTIADMQSFDVIWLVGNLRNGRTALLDGAVFLAQHVFLSSNLRPTINIDEQQLQEAIEISKTQKLTIHANSNGYESNDLMQLIYKLTSEYNLQSIFPQNPLKFVLVGIRFGLVDQAVESKLVNDVIAICFRVIKYILALIRHLLRIQLISYIVQALHRILYSPHSFIHGPGNTDDDNSNSLHSIAARMFSSRKGNVLLASLSPG